MVGPAPGAPGHIPAGRDRGAAAAAAALLVGAEAADVVRPAVLLEELDACRCRCCLIDATRAPAVGRDLAVGLGVGLGLGLGLRSGSGSGSRSGSCSGLASYRLAGVGVDDALDRVEATAVTVGVPHSRARRIVVGCVRTRDARRVGRGSGEADPRCVGMGTGKQRARRGVLRRVVNAREVAAQLLAPGQG